MCFSSAHSATRYCAEHRTLTTHNDSLRHWQGDHGVMYELFEQRFLVALREFEAAESEYINVHAPLPFCAPCTRCASAQLPIHQLYATRYGACESWMIDGADHSATTYRRPSRSSHKPNRVRTARTQVVYSGSP